MASSFCARHLGLNFFPSFSSFSGFCGVQRLVLCFTHMVTISFPVVVGSTMKKIAVDSLVRRHGPIIIFLNACYRVALGRLGHSRTLLFFHLCQVDKSHACLIILFPSTIVMTRSGRFETIRHTQYGIIHLQDNINPCQVTILKVVLQFAVLVVRNA